MRLISAGLAALIMAATPVYSGPADRAWDAYLIGDFAAVKRIAAAAASDTTLTAEQAARVYVALGASQAMQGQDTDATASFELAFQLNPVIPLTSADLPPPVWRLFSPVKERLSHRSRTPFIPVVIKPVDAVPRVDTVRVKIPLYHRGSAAVKSLVFPGWGHIAERRKTGYAIAAGGALFLAGWIGAMISADDARDDYLRARHQNDIERNYDRYNSLHRASWAFGLSAAAVYIYAQFDFFRQPAGMNLSLDNHDGFRMLSLAVRCER